MNNLDMYNKHLKRYTEHYTTSYLNWHNKTEYANQKAEENPPIVRRGRKFDKIVYQNSVMAFVAKANGVHKGIQYKMGDVFRSATRNQPAKHVRGSIFAESYDEWNSWTGPGYMFQLKGDK